MSVRNLVEDQCGGPNSLVQLTSHFVQDRGLKDQGLIHPFQHKNYPDQDAEKVSFTTNSPSFRMDSILSDMRDLEVATLAEGPQMVNQRTMDPLKNENVSEWANQYLESGSKFASVEDRPFQQSIWSNDEANESSKLDQISKLSDINEFDFNANFGYENSPHFTDMYRGFYSLPAHPFEISELQYVAGQVVDSMSDPRFSDSKFLKFMNQVSEGQVQISGNQFVGANNENSTFDKWANEAQSSKISSSSAIDANEEKSFSQWGNLPSPSITDENRNTLDSEKLNDLNVSEDTYSKELWSKLTERWEQLNLTDQDPWNTEFSKFVASVQAYNFAEENPMEDKVNALEEGKKRLNEEDLPSAILCFEAAVKQNPESVEGWLLLGRTQAENEQDQQAISALKKCLQLDQNNLEAWQELAVCYTNENYQFQACYALKEWLARNPKYASIVAESLEGLKSDSSNEVTSLLTMKFFNDVLNLYLKAAQRFSEEGELDADVQNALGVLQTLNSDYEKAIDCFETAVTVRPNDFRLWNRLGATLANGQKPEQALEAYRKTLKLSPGFIRARYNLGITCVHLKMYRQAVEHLLIALNQQVSGRGLHGEKSLAMSESIWTTLRLALALMDRKDLYPAAEKKDLEILNKEFNINKLQLKSEPNPEFEGEQSQPINEENQKFEEAQPSAAS